MTLDLEKARDLLRRYDELSASDEAKAANPTRNFKVTYTRLAHQATPYLREALADIQAAKGHLARVIEEREDFRQQLLVEREGRLLAMRQIMDALGMPAGSTMVTENVVERIRDLGYQALGAANDAEHFEQANISLAREKDKLEFVRNAEREILSALLEALVIAAKDAEEAAGRARTSDLSILSGPELVYKILMDASRLMSGLSSSTTKLLEQIQAAFDAPTQEEVDNDNSGG